MNIPANELHNYVLIHKDEKARLEARDQEFERAVVSWKANEEIDAAIIEDLTHRVEELGKALDDLDYRPDS